MKEVINEIFDKEIAVAVASFPSMYSKDDVICVINKLKEDITALDFIDYNSEETKDYNIEAIKKAMVDFLDNEGDLVDYDSIDLSIGYDNKIEINCVEINSQVIADHLEEIMDRIL
tara:strand:- start:271 stop:618 length:348 start_codon:yes stop_codon:yes gene_type:complete